MSGEDGGVGGFERRKKMVVLLVLKESGGVLGERVGLEEPSSAWTSALRMRWLVGHLVKRRERE